jgi:serine O-acetyltransferase
MDGVNYQAMLARLVTHQVGQLFPDFERGFQLDPAHVAEALARTDHCVAHIIGFTREHFDHLVSGQYATFLYYLANTMHRRGADKRDVTRVFLVNKALNGIDLFYEVEMPEVFLIGHTVGMVYAKASYGNYCIFHQGCTVGRNGLDRPQLEDGVIMYPNSSIVGRCHVRENTVLSLGVQLLNTDTPGNCIVFPGEHGKVVFKPITEYYADRYLVRGARTHERPV